jgi:hypothetical protein
VLWDSSLVEPSAALRHCCPLLTCHHPFHLLNKQNIIKLEQNKPISVLALAHPQRCFPHLTCNNSFHLLNKQNIIKLEQNKPISVFALAHPQRCFPHLTCHHSFHLLNKQNITKIRTKIQKILLIFAVQKALKDSLQGTQAIVLYRRSM